jgi:hypothetical protein
MPKADTPSLSSVTTSSIGPASSSLPPINPSPPCLPILPKFPSTVQGALQTASEVFQHRLRSSPSRRLEEVVESRCPKQEGANGGWLKARAAKVASVLPSVIHSTDNCLGRWICHMLPDALQARYSTRRNRIHY